MLDLQEKMNGTDGLRGVKEKCRTGSIEDAWREDLKLKSGTVMLAEHSQN